MTEEHYNYRTSQALLRNQFPGSGKLKIPIISKFEAIPNFEKPHINYWPEDYPNGAPEFKSYGGRSMYNGEEDNRFKTISEFKECIIRGGEPVFVWNGNAYGVCFSDTGYCNARIDGPCERMCTTPDSVLEYALDGDRLRDIITRVTVVSRNI